MVVCSYKIIYLDQGMSHCIIVFKQVSKQKSLKYHFLTLLLSFENAKLSDFEPELLFRVGQGLSQLLTLGVHVVQLSLHDVHDDASLVSVKTIVVVMRTPMVEGAADSGCQRGTTVVVDRQATEQGSRRGSLFLVGKVQGD